MQQKTASRFSYVKPVWKLRKRRKTKRNRTFGYLNSKSRDNEKETQLNQTLRSKNIITWGTKQKA